MQVAVVAGGLGTRMRSTLGDIPKSLADINGVPFAALQLAWLREASSVHFCLGHGSREILEALGEIPSHARPPLTWTREHRPLGVIGSLRHSLDYLDSTFAFLLGDTVPRVPFKELLEATSSLAREGKTVMALAPAADIPGQRGNVGAAGSRVEAYCKDEAFTGIFVDIGFGLMQKEHLERFPNRSDEEHFYNALIGSGLLAGARVPKRSWEVGSPEGLASLRASHRRGEHTQVLLPTQSSSLDRTATRARHL